MLTSPLLLISELHRGPPMLRRSTATVLVGLLLTFTLTACTTAPRYRDAQNTVQATPEGQARIFFYGDSLAWKGFPAGKQWRPTIQLNGEAVPTVNGREVVFYLDRAPGTYKISVDNDSEITDRKPPDHYPGKSISLKAKEGRAYYVRMIRHGPDNLLALEPQLHYMELKEVHHVRGEVEIGRFHFSGS